MSIFILYGFLEVILSYFVLLPSVINLVWFDFYFKFQNFSWYFLTLILITQFSKIKTFKTQLKSHYKLLPPVKQGTIGFLFKNSFWVQNWTIRRTQIKGLFKRKCISIVHCLMICAGISYGHVTDEETAVWLFRIHSEIWCGYFLADTIVSEWNGTASFGKGFESCIFRSKFQFCLNSTKVNLKALLNLNHIP